MPRPFAWVLDSDQTQHAADGDQHGGDAHRKVECVRRRVRRVPIAPGHDRAHERDSQQAGHPGNRVVHAAGDARVVLVGPREHRRGERSDGHRQPDGKDQQRREQVGQVVDVRLQHREERQADASHDRPHPHEEARPVAVRQRAEAHGREEHHDRHRERRAAGRDRAVAGRVLEEQHQEEEEQRQTGVHGEGLQVADREVVPAKEAEREHRVRSAGLVEDERHERGDAAEQRDRDARVAEAPDLRLADETERDCGEAECTQEPAGHVDLGVLLRAASLRHRPDDEHDRRDHQRHVDGEDPPPGGRVDELAADQRPDHDADSAPRGPGTDGLATFVLWKHRDYHRQRGRSEERPRHALQGSADHQHLDRRGDRADDRGHAKGRHAQRKDPSLAEEVAERAADEYQRGQRDQVCVGRPLLAGEAAAEVLADRGQRHVDHGGVHRDDC